MKKILLSLGIVFAITACNQKPEGYTIKGNLTGEVENGTQVFLRKMGDNMQPVDIDTTTIENGQFAFSGSSVEAPEMHFLFVDKLLGYTAVILENGEVQVTAHKDSLSGAETKGTPQNDYFAKYMDNSRALSKQALSIQNDIQDATMSQDQAILTSLNEEMADLQEQAQAYELTYINENPDALISVLLLERVIASRQLPYDEVQAMYDGISPEIKETSAAKKVVEQLEQMKQRTESEKNTEVGAKAPQFSGPTPEGKTLALNDAMGKVTLIDFWAAWCKPCRMENPNVVKVYGKYHDKGLNIIGVSLDKTAEDWKKAIEDDGLTWNQVSNLAYFNDPIAKLYNVDAIPAAFLIDENGIIVGKNLRGQALEDKVAELLN